MARAQNGSIELEYETFGSPRDPAVLLIAGYTAQLTMWDENLCRQMVNRELFVIRFDNRDTGLSSKTGGTAPSFLSLLAAVGGGQTVGNVLYSLSDMAADALAVLDDLGVTRANLVGASMGAMIAQVLTIEHPERVATLTSIMSTTGDPRVGQPTPEAISAMFRPPPIGRRAVIDRAVAIRRLFAGVHFDAARARREETEAYERGYYPTGGAFQMAAILTAPDRTGQLGLVRIPTLVIHGGADPLIQPSGGRATAAAVPGAQLILIDDMGHDLPPAHRGLMVDTIAAMIHNTERCRRSG